MRRRCSSCYGKGMYKMPNGWSGSATGRSTFCLTCGGKGWVEEEIPRRRSRQTTTCSVCRGTGKVPGSNREPCAFCGGEGVSYYEDHDKPLKKKKPVSSSARTCPRCWGKGMCVMPAPGSPSGREWMTCNFCGGKGVR